jgi:hypothetical protein
VRLADVVRVQQGQRTPVFQRYPMPEYDALSLSVIYREGRGGRERSLDLVCRSPGDFDVWFWGLRLVADWARGCAGAPLQPEAAEAAAVAAAAAAQAEARARLVGGGARGRGPGPRRAVIDRAAPRRAAAAGGGSPTACKVR